MEIEDEDGEVANAHKIIGFIVFALVLLQVRESGTACRGSQDFNAFFLSYYNVIAFGWPTCGHKRIRVEAGTAVWMRLILAKRALPCFQQKQSRGKSSRM